MSLYKKRGSDIWYVGLTRNGKRIQFSTRTTDKAEAGLIEAAFKMRLDGGRRDRFIQLMDAVMGGECTGVLDAPQRSLLSNLPDLANEDATGVCERSRYDRVRMTRNFVEWMKERVPGAVLVTDVTPTLAWDYVKSLSDGRTTRTAQKIAAQLSVVWSGLVRRGLVKENVWRYTHVKSAPSDGRTGRAFTADEVSAILAAAKGTWLEVAVMVAVYTGFRQGDVLALEWGSVDMEGGAITVTPSKTSRHARVVTVPLHPSLREFLEALPPPHEGRVVSGVPLASWTISKAWKESLAKAGVRAEGNEMMTFHNLRHTFTTWVRMTGADKGDTMLLCGHTNMATNNRYDHATTRLKEVIDKLPTI